MKATRTHINVYLFVSIYARRSIFIISVFMIVSLIILKMSFFFLRLVMHCCFGALFTPEPKFEAQILIYPLINSILNHTSSSLS